ncbi:MAG: hypothetical protein ACHQ7M_16055 [Chloroflexota bacterium]
MSTQDETPVADYDSPWKEALAHYLPEAFALCLPEGNTLGLMSEVRPA